MDSNRACRLCFDFPEDFVDIFEDFEDSTIAAIVTQHFEFQIYKGDGSLADCLCQTCWTNTKNFHIFHKKVSTLQKNHSQSMDIVEQDSHENETANNPNNSVIKLEPTQMDTIEEMKACIVKIEEISPAIAFDLQIKSKDDADYDPSEFSDSEGDHSSDDEEQYLIMKGKSPNNGVENENSKLDDADESSNQRLNTRRTNRSKNSQTKNTSKRDTATEDAQIREFCNMKCEICSEQFETFTKAKRHYRIVHNTAGYLRCCRTKYYRRVHALDHILRHINPDIHRCENCGKFFANKITLKNHMETHEPLDSRAYKCDMCSSSFNKPWKLTHHKRIQHCSEEDKKFHCDHCNKNFASQSILNYHIRCVHDPAHIHVCDICAKMYKDKPSFQRHMQEHSAVIKPKIQCNVCGAWLKNDDSLRSHLKTHQDAPVNCSICNKMKPNKRSLRTHMRDVHGEKRFQCTMCDKAFRKILVFKEHMATHTGEMLYECTYCTKPFKCKSNMRVHCKKAHFTEWTRERLKRLNPAADQH